MRAYPEVAFTLDSRRRKLPASAAAVLARPAPVDGGVPRVARLMGIAIRLNGLVRAGAIRDYAEAARHAAAGRRADHAVPCPSTAPRSATTSVRRKRRRHKAANLFVSMNQQENPK